MENSALLLIDIQNDYFEGGKYPLHNPEDAGEKAGILLKYFRENKGSVIHIQHEMLGDNPLFFEVGTIGQEIHESVKPAHTDLIITKNNPNSFQDTQLLSVLREKNIKRLIVCGMMTHMCVASTVREAFEHGFETFVVSDAAATLDLKLDGKTIQAEQVHEANLAGLGAVFAQVVTTEDMLERLKD